MLFALSIVLVFGVVGARGIVRWSYESDTYRQRARPEEIFRAIEGLSRGPA